MNETTISIEGVSLIEFFGAGNAKFNIIREAFPKLKLIPRGNNIKMIGKNDAIQQFTQKVDEIIDFLQLNGSITKNQLQDLLDGVLPASSQVNGNGDNILYGQKGRTIKARTPNQKKLVEAIEANDIVFAIGPAGTGKTYTAVAMAVKALKNNLVKKIVLTRPAVEAGESLGYLPGDLKDKIDPYLRPLYDALDDMIPSSKLNQYMANRVIEIAPLAYMRGRTIDKSFIILDEAQNATDLQLKMILTRIGPSSQCVITGDLTQIDLPRNHKSGLSKCLSILDNIKGIEVVRLGKEDVVRHRLVKRIIEAYEQSDNREIVLKKKDNA